MAIYTNEHLTDLLNDEYEKVRKLEQELQKTREQLEKAVEIIEFYLSKDLSDCIFESDEDRHRQFLAKYRGGNDSREI